MMLEPSGLECISHKAWDIQFRAFSEKWDAPWLSEWGSGGKKPVKRVLWDKYIPE